MSLFVVMIEMIVGEKYSFAIIDVSLFQINYLASTP